MDDACVALTRCAENDWRLLFQKASTKILLYLMAMGQTVASAGWCGFVGVVHVHNKAGPVAPPAAAANPAPLLTPVQCSALEHDRATMRARQRAVKLMACS